MEFRTKLKIIGTLLFTITSFLSAFSVSEEVRLVIILTLFFGGFGAGATLVSFIKDLKQKTKQAGA